MSFHPTAYVFEDQIIPFFNNLWQILGLSYIPGVFCGFCNLMFLMSLGRTGSCIFFLFWLLFPPAPPQFFSYFLKYGRTILQGTFRTLKDVPWAQILDQNEPILIEGDW